MSALVYDAGQVTLTPDPGVRLDAAGSSSVASALLDASGEKWGFVGAVWHPTVKTGTINIRKVHFRCGTVTINASSVFRVSLQNISATAGPPYQPDGTQDQLYDFASNSLAAGWNTTGNLSADRAVDLSADSIGDANSRWLAVVLEYQTFTAADIVNINVVNGSPHSQGIGGSLFHNATSWAVNANTPLVLFECDDGTFAFLRGATVFTAFGTASVASNGAIRRAGLKIKFATERAVSAFSLFATFPNGCDGRFVLYDSDGTTELRSVDVDNDAVHSAGSVRFCEIAFEPVTFAANTYYRIVFLASTTTAATIYYGDVNAAGHMDGLNVPGKEAHWTQHDGTNWADTTTRRPFFAIGQVAFHDGSGGGGGLLRHPGMAGGCSA